MTHHVASHLEGTDPAAPSFERYGGTAAENYERYFVPAIAAPLAVDLIELARLDVGERVLDMACGTGVVARLAADRVGPGSVTGVDVNPGMLAVARSRTAAGAGIEWRQADAQATRLSDCAYDAVLCQLGLQFFADRTAALREMLRVLTPGGRLVANLPGPTPPIFGALEEALSAHVSPATAGFVSAVFSLHDPSALMRLFVGAGFSDTSVAVSTKSLHLPFPSEFLWQYVSSTPLITAVAGLDARDRASLERDVVARWDRFTDDRGLILELEMITATAHKEEM
jgi:SAM-dependent methyltransferase